MIGNAKIKSESLPFHGGNTGSIPVRVTRLKTRSYHENCVFFLLIYL